VAANNAGLLSSIPETQAAALTYANLGLGQYETAWQRSLAIADPYEQARAQALIAQGWAQTDASAARQAVEQMSIDVLRQRALVATVTEQPDQTLLEKISLPYLRVQALTRMGETGQAVQEAANLKEKLPLVELALKVMENDPQTALALVELMSREADKAAVLVPLAGNDPNLFERALGMAGAARVRGENGNPTRLSLALANLLWNTRPDLARLALEQALKLAEGIK
jgi:hypothetical protein